MLDDGRHHSLGGERRRLGDGDEPPWPGSSAKGSRKKFAYILLNSSPMIAGCVLRLRLLGFKRMRAAGPRELGHAARRRGDEHGSAAAKLLAQSVQSRPEPLELGSFASASIASLRIASVQIATRPS